MSATYAERAAAGTAWRRPLVGRALERFRRWDRAASVRVDRFVANSRHIAAAITRCYGRDAEVVYPPVDVDALRAGRRDARAEAPRSDYVTVSRLVPYKRVDVLVEAFRALPERRLIVIGDGPDRSRLEALAVPNVVFAGRAGRCRDRAPRRRGPRVPVRCRGGFRHRARRGASRRDAGDRLRARRRAGIDPRAGRSRFPPACSSTRRRHRRSSTPSALSRPEPCRISAAACRENALRFAPARFRDEMARIVDARRRRARPRAGGQPDDAPQPAQGEFDAARRGAARSSTRCSRSPPASLAYHLYFDTLGHEGAVRDRAARRRAARVRRVPVVQALPVAARHLVRRGGARRCSSRGSRSP